MQIRKDRDGPGLPRKLPTVRCDQGKRRSENTRTAFRGDTMADNYSRGSGGTKCDTRSGPLFRTLERSRFGGGPDLGC